MAGEEKFDQSPVSAEKVAEKVKTSADIEKEVFDAQGHRALLERVVNANTSTENRGLLIQRADEMIDDGQANIGLIIAELVGDESMARRAQTIIARSGAYKQPEE